MIPSWKGGVPSGGVIGLPPGITVWYDAAEAGNTSSLWQDKSGNGYDLDTPFYLGTSSPWTLVDGAVNGLPAYQNGGYSNGIFTSSLVPFGTSMQVYVVYQFAPSENSYLMFFGAGELTNTGPGEYYPSAWPTYAVAGTTETSYNGISLWNPADSPSDYGGSTTADALPHIGVVQIDLSTGFTQGALDFGALGGGYDYPAYDTSSVFRYIGPTYWLDLEIMDGYLCEIIEFSRQLTDSEDLVVRTYLANKWGIPL